MSVPQADYAKRMKRYEDAVACRESDRIVVSPQVLYLPITLYGETTIARVMQDFTQAYSSWMRYHREFQPDLSWGLQSIFSSAFCEAMGCTFIKWPGKHFDNVNMGFQAIDTEYMLQNEYLAYADDPSGYMLRRLLPKHYETMEAMGDVDFSSMLYLGAMNGMATFGRKEPAAMLDALVEGGRIAQTAANDAARLVKMLCDEGWPPANEYVVNVPYDVLSDTMRGMLSTSMDMYDCPEELLAAVDTATRLQIRAIREHMTKTPTYSVYFYLHNGMDTFMSAEQFERFYWPGLKACMDTVIECGGICKLYTQGPFDRKLEILSEVPKGKVVYFFTGTNMKRAKAVFSGKSCIAGGIDGLLLAKGTPEQICRNVREILEICMPGGGYILDTTIQLDYAREENLHAMFDTAFRYGEY